MIFLQAGDPVPKAPTANSSSGNNSDTTATGIGLYAVVLIGGLLAYFGYQYMEAQQQQQQQQA